MTTRANAKLAATLVMLVVGCSRPPTVRVTVADEAHDAIVVTALVEQRDFRAADLRVSGRDSLHETRFVLRVEGVEPSAATSWLDDSLVVEKRTTTQDASAFVGARVRAYLDPHHGRGDGPWRGLHLELVESAPLPPCPDGAPSGTVPIAGSQAPTSVPGDMSVIEGTVLTRHFDNVQKVASSHPGYEPLQRIVFVIDVRSSFPPELSERIVPPFRVTRVTRPRDLEIREGDVVRVVFEARPGVLEMPTKFAWSEELSRTERACGRPSARKP